jgi:hypothetical protein
LSVRIPIQITDAGRLIVSAILVDMNTRKNAPVNFILDTGAPHTLLSQPDIQKVDIDYYGLPHNPQATGGLGGNAETRIASNVMIVIPCEEKNMAIEILKDTMLVVRSVEPVQKHNRKTMIKSTNRVTIPSLLGVDLMTENDLVLHCDFKKRVGYLERP